MLQIVVIMLVCFDWTLYMFDDGGGGDDDCSLIGHYLFVWMVGW